MIFIACTGFFILFNVHDWGSILCALGGVFTWMTYLLCRDLGMSIYSMNFFAAVVSALYSEILATRANTPSRRTLSSRSCRWCRARAFTTR